MKFRITLTIFSWTLIAAAALADPPPYNNPSIATSDPQIGGWAFSVVEYSPATGPAAGSGSAALGVANGAFASLGDLTAAQLAQQTPPPPGHITLKFDSPFRNGTGWDLAVFENAFAFGPTDFAFGELAYVEVSSDGANFARFPSISLNVNQNPSTDPDAVNELYTLFGRDFAGLNTAYVHDLAGIHPQGFGTEFDLDDLLGNSLVTGGQVNLGRIQYVRVIDVPGNGSSLDGAGHAILDAWVTTGTGAGFDLDAIAAHYVIPEPAALTLAIAAMLAVCSYALVNRRRADARD